MMIRSLLISLAFGTALATVHAIPSYAQTTETDQSEEDWRKSRKKRSTTPDIFDPNNTTIGQGINDIKPLTPIEKLPRDSQRHLKKLRAEIIAESDPGEIADTSYKPSEAAKNDPDLAAQEEEAWKIIVTDLELGGGQGSQPQDQSQDGEKIAVVGRNTTPPSGQNSGGGFGGAIGAGTGSGSQSSGGIRGGSSSSVADILAQIKGIKASRGQGDSEQGGSGQDGTGQDRNDQTPFGIGQSGQPPFGIDQGGQGPSGQGQSGQNPSGQASQNQSQAQNQSSGQSGQGASSSQNSTQNQGQSPSSQGQDQGQNQGQSQQPGQSTAQAQGQSSAQGAQGQETAQSQANSSTRAERERLSPLETLKRERRERVTGDTTSASDFLKTKPIRPDN